MAAADYDCVDPDVVGELAPVTHLLGNSAALDSVWRERGALLFRNVLDKTLVEATRRDFMAALHAQGVVKSADDPTAMSAVNIEKTDQSALYASEGYKRLLNAPSTASFLAGIFGEPVYMSDAVAIRWALPGDVLHMIPPHQDGSSIPRTDFRTVWIPLMEIPRVLGGLAVLEGSHHAGKLPVVNSSHLSVFYTGSYKTRASYENVSGRWASASFSPGDCLLFHPYTVHAPLPNREQRVRLSVDVRVQPAAAPLVSSKYMTLDREGKRRYRQTVLELARQEGIAVTDAEQLASKMAGLELEPTVENLRQVRAGKDTNSMA